MRIVQALGHDRDVAARRGRAPAARRRARHRPRRWTGGRRPAASSPGVELRIVDDDGQRAAVGRRGGRRDRGARAVDHRRRTTAIRRPRSSTTAGCAPATSAASTRDGFVQITDRAKDVIKSGGEWISLGRAREPPDGAPRRRRGRGDRRARPALGRAAARVRRAQGRRDVGAAELARRSSAARSRSGSCPSAGPSSTRCRRRASASSTRRCCGPATRRVTWPLKNWAEQARRSVGRRRHRVGADAQAGRDRSSCCATASTGSRRCCSRRSSKLAFHGGAWVFPGGRIDDGDWLDGDDLARAARARRGTRDEGGGRRRRRRRLARALLQLDDARHLAEALRDVVLRRRPRTPRSRRPSPTASSRMRCAGSVPTMRSPNGRRARSSWRRRSTSRCSGCATTRPSTPRWPGSPADDADRLHAPLPLHRGRRRDLRLRRRRRVGRPRRGSSARVRGTGWSCRPRPTGCTSGRD